MIIYGNNGYMVIWLLLLPINNGYLYDNNLLIIMIDGKNGCDMIMVLINNGNMIMVIDNNGCYNGWDILPIW